ncbi:hypothetical protein JW964_28560 [candidate division KSB1 bacterium]|nr:hypothetical protein [candidate division KSB1 bacterium]
MSQPRISELNTWENFRNTIFAVIREALCLLRESENLPQIEDSPTRANLNRKLYYCFREICHRKELNYHLPTLNGKNPPVDELAEPDPRENKLPDFQWHFIDHTADAAYCACHFVVECKRLGKPSSPTWNLNQNYVKNGINRFISPEHGYGKGDDTCGMIGYVQSMSFGEILDEINTEIKINAEEISTLVPPKSGWTESGVSEIEQMLTRVFQISPFVLWHLWIDLRDKY